MTLLAAEPQMFVSDLDAALEHYVGRLGFRLAFAYGEPAFYAQVVRDDARLNLRRVEASPFSPRFHEGEPDLLSATIIVDDIESLAAEFEGAGVAFHQPPRIEAWGARTFIVSDPDGNLLAFAA